MKLTGEEIQTVLKALLGKASEDLADSLKKEYGIRALCDSNETIRAFRNKLFTQES